MFERITPESAGISSYKVKEFIDMLERRNLPMHSVLIMKGDKLLAEYYWAPFDKDFCHRMYSQTKSYTAVAIGLLEEEGKIDLDRPMADYFPEKIYTPLPSHLAKQTVREMLTMTTAGDCANWFRDKEFDDRTKLYFNYARTEGNSHAAGTSWAYDSAGSQVLANLVEKTSGMSLFDYLTEKVFRHLGTFKTATILKTRNGDSWGDSALVCTPRDMISFARFVMNYGTFDGKRLMNEKYLRTATAKQVSNAEWGVGAYSYGYGYQIWCTEQGGFAFNGMGSQLTVCLPERDLIFVCTADTQGIAYAGEIITNGFYDLIVNSMKDEPLPEDKAATAALDARVSSLSLYHFKGQTDSPMREVLDGTVYECSGNVMGWKKFSFHFKSATEGELHYTNAQGDKILPFGVNRNVFGKFPELGYSNDNGGIRTTDGFMYNDAVSFAWLEDSKIGIKVQIIDRYFGNANLFFGFKGDDATLLMTKTAEDFLDEYQGRATAKKIN